MTAIGHAPKSAHTLLLTIDREFSFFRTRAEAKPRLGPPTRAYSVALADHFLKNGCLTDTRSENRSRILRNLENESNGPRLAADFATTQKEEIKCIELTP